MISEAIMRSRLILVVATLCFAAACSVNVKKDNGGDDKNVDIKTPFTDIHVEKNADARATGLPIYPGARLKPKTGEDDNNANVNLSAFGFGLKVVVQKYESEDASSKVEKFYEGELKKYGSVLQCHTSHHGNYDAGSYSHNSSGELKCNGDNSGNVVELKAGNEGNQHIVAIEPQGKGTDFTLVYVHTHGKEDTI
jgi:hypothetical protein